MFDDAPFGRILEQRVDWSKPWVERTRSQTIDQLTEERTLL